MERTITIAVVVDEQLLCVPSTSHLLVVVIHKKKDCFSHRAFVAEFTKVDTLNQPEIIPSRVLTVYEKFCFY